MAVGMPRDATAKSTVLALSSATMALGCSSLGICIVLVVLRNLNSPSHNAWPALLFLLPIAVLACLAHFPRSTPAMAVSLALAVTSLSFYSSVIIANAPESIVESPFILALPQVAIIYTIAPVAVGVRSFVFITVAYLWGQVAVLCAAVEAGRYPAFDYLTLVATIVLLLISGLSLALYRRSAADRRAVARARREVDAVNYQQELESQVVSLFHDTVLSELTVLSHHEPGPLSPAERTAVERDLAMIAQGAWWPAEGSESSPAALTPAFAGVLAASRGEGLSIDVSGDLASLHRLTAATSTALALAVRQALVNVRQHSGVDHAEIVVDGAPDAVVVMLADAGTGFDSAAVPADRLGVAQSIRGRIRDAGGEAQLWTSPGSGTAYMFTLPAAPEHSWDDA
ncbi:sensor histidine kinase [Herbiconiux daphne]|uniref:ATP-binding protein n=1 Tax=Herbiconiux daphne TaxID=2970914 RepID=A0ABT2H6I0_9MICO|nr:hypothetical protein [Herbiconiux daphne]MCS5735545.1 hypothetical protein [Herbiconiux daphne]